MSDQTEGFFLSYGKAMFYSYLIEDIVALHLRKCSHFKVNSYSRSEKAVASLNHKGCLDELRKVYESSGPSFLKLVDSLHDLRIIRNKLTHDILRQVFNDLKSEEGIEQIIALISEIATWAKLLHNQIILIDTSLTRAISQNTENAITFDLILSFKDTEFIESSAKSEIRRHLDSIKSNYLPED